ncbi:hypothetical protein PIB30_021448 [Stylosanthes scabra]|uniref:Uncharacterized protein n=1 Tax=Stylosanthes scabra TaxID=79078 RepID=A0ABU6VBX2_9FABA|nr:hypothetical protein [Stylosanthes scabra]
MSSSVSFSWYPNESLFWIAASLSARASATKGDDTFRVPELIARTLSLLSLQTRAIKPTPDDLTKEASTFNFVHPIGSGFQVAFL